MTRISTRTPGSPAPRGFTLIELLVVIAVVGILIGILLPVLSKARECAMVIGELSAGRQFMTAHQMYSHDHDGWVLPGYASNQMVRSGQVIAKNALGQRLENPVANRYPWRLMPYLDYTLEANYRDTSIIGALPDEDKNYAVALAPRFGLNQSFVGGSADSDGMGVSLADSQRTRDQANAFFGPRWFVRRTDDVRSPSSLIVFASSHGAPPIGSVVLDGYFKIAPPNFFTRNWKPTDPGSAAEPPDTGFVSFRFSGRTVATHFDGHAESLDWSECQDMRRWAPRALTADWPRR